MSEARLGTLCDKTAARDAIHVAIAPTEAATTLWPGQRVELADSGKAIPLNAGKPMPANSGKPVGIVDPFLTQPVYAGEWFCLCLPPGTVTGMRHHWEHPAFSDTPPTDQKAASIAWLKSACDRLGIGYEESISEDSPLVNGDYINNGEGIRDMWYELEDEFWKHREIVTGVKSEDCNQGGFTCSC